MKSAVRMLSVEATRLPTFTWLVGENSTPFGLIRKIWPLAVIAPWMTDTSEPSTRLSATALAPGWTKFTVLPLPTEKPCQSIASLFEAWLMVMALPLWLMLPLPATMLPPVGRVPAAQLWPAPANARVATTSNGFADLLLPRPRAHSATACQAPTAEFQTTR